MDLRSLGRAAKVAGARLSAAPTAAKDDFLERAARGMRERAGEVLEANAGDLAEASLSGLRGAMLDRLRLTPERVEGMAVSLEAVAALPDPVGSVDGLRRRPNGLLVGRQRIPLGVVAIIYEARPNVTSEAASLCIKAGNAALLKGGREAQRSNKAIAEVLREALDQAGLPRDALVSVPAADRSVVKELVELEDYVDLVIPRGGEGLIRFVTDHARVPVIQHFKGNCHVYVHEGADLEKATSIVVNAKTQRPGVCNAAETLLVDAGVAGTFLPEVAKELSALGVELRGCPEARALVAGVLPATEEDWEAEYLDLTLAVRVVKDLEEAVAHIEAYASGHTEAIVSEDYTAARAFVERVQSSCVVVNASTRFNDGFELGLGAEIGISTTKLHAYGPMGLEELTARKFVVYGDGQVRN